MLLHDVEEMAATFASFDVVYANFATHLCAKHSLVSLQDYVWHTPPSLLQQFLQRDCNARYSLINEAFVPKKKLHYSVS